MARSILETVIKIVKEGGGDKETISALGNIKSGLAQAGMVAGTVTAAFFTVKKVLDETVTPWVDYALAMEDGRKVTNMTVEEFSRLVQAADDMRVSQESVVSAMQFAVRQGYQPSVTWLKEVAEQYNSLPTGAERGAFAIKVFGRSAGPELQKLLEQGSDGIETLMASIGDGLVVTNEAVTKAKQLALAQDELQDSWTETKNIIGRSLVPALADGLDWFNRYHEGVKEGKNSWMQYVPVLQMGYYAFHAIKTATEDDTDAANENSWAVAVQTEAYLQQLGILPKVVQQYELTAEEAKALSDEYKSLIQTTTSIQSETDSYKDKMGELEEKAAGLRGQIAELEGKKFLTSEQKTELQDLYTQLDGVTTEMYDLGQEADKAGKKLVFNLLQAKLSADGLTTAEYNLLIQTGTTFGIIDQESADAAISINNLVDQFAAGNAPLSTFDAYIKSIMGLPQVMSKEVYVKWQEEWSGGGGGGGQGGNNSWYQFGADMLVTKPTMIGVGEAGPERVIVEPLGSGGRYDLMPVQGGAGNGPIIVQVFLDGRMVQETLAMGLAVQGL